MTADMVNPHEGDIIGKGQGLGKVQADEKGTDQPGMVGRCDCIQLGKADPRLGKCAVGDGGDDLAVGTGCDLGHNAAVETVGVGLGGHDVRKDGEPISLGTDDGGRRFITGAFNCK